MEKLERGSSDIIIENNSNITFVRWKDDKVVAVASTLYSQSPMKKAQRHIKEKHGRADTKQPQSIYQYDQETGGVDRLHQNISAYMIVLIFQSVMLIRFIAIKKHLLGEKNLIYQVSGETLSAPITTESKYLQSLLNSFSAPRKSVKVSCDIRYENNSLVRVINEGVVGATK